jgi:hypothetical protein
VVTLVRRRKKHSRSADNKVDIVIQEDADSGNGGGDAAATSEEDADGGNGGGDAAATSEGRGKDVGKGGTGGLRFEPLDQEAENVVSV